MNLASPALVLVLFATAGCSGAQDDAESSASPSATFVAPPDMEVTELDTGPVGVAAVGGEAWSVLTEDGEVRMADDQRIAVGEAPLRLVDTPAGVWVSVIGEGRLVRIDPRSGKVDLRVRLRPAGSEPEGLAYDGQSVWVVDQAGDRVLPMDPRSGRFGPAVSVGIAPRLVSSGPSGVWVSNYDGGSVSRVRDGRVRTEDLAACASPQGLAEAGAVIWVACTDEDRVLGLDAQTLAVVATFDGLDAADAVVADGDTVFAVGQAGPTVWRIDAGQRTVGKKVVLDEIGTTRENVGAAVVAGHLVVTHPESRRIYALPLASLR
ncbi:hypothetical protein [Nocardioides sp.]|uniref:hypothetical protein n=1 Tax=Nocardioides sp. TaxID=35761 RepID=UPI003D134A02